MGERTHDVLPNTACKEVRYFFDYWRMLKKKQSVPPAQSVDMIDFFDYLSRVFILVGRDVEDLRVRFAGTAYQELYGFEVTGYWVVDLIPFAKRNDLLASYDFCLKENTPVYETNTMTWGRYGSKLSFQRILLPFRGPNMTKTILAFAQFFDEQGNVVFH